MRVAKQDVPVKIDAPGAVACQQADFGDTTGLGKIGGGTSPWAKVPASRSCCTGSRETCARCRAGATWSKGAWRLRTPTARPSRRARATGSTGRTDEDSEIILFGLQAEHSPVIEHLRAKMLGW